MSIDFLKRAGWFVVFVIAQAIFFGRIHLFDYATPLVYIYFVAMFPRNYPKWAILLWSFMLGLTVDTFSNTPGVAAAALTLVGVLQPYFFEVFVPRDSIDSLVPSVQSLGLAKFFYYIAPLVLIFCLVFFTLETFSFFNWKEWVLCVSGSTAVTLLIIMTFEISRGE